LILWTWISGCATLNPGPRRDNFAPLFIYSEDEEKEGKALDILGPFLSYRKDSQETEFAFRPLFYRKEEPQHVLLEYLYPFGKYEKTAEVEDSYLTLFYSTRRDLTQPETKKKERTFLLAIWGETRQGETYGGLFPIYGHLKERFGKDEITFFLWPLYTRSRVEENQTTSFLWPIFTLTEGGGRNGWKVWPLAGHETKENDYEKSFFLWPFFIFEKRHLYTDDPTTVDIILPFYVSMASSKRTHRSVLWPFFHHTWDEEDRYNQWDLPWPIFQRAEGTDKSMFRIFPFYGHKYWEGRENGYLLWPVYIYNRHGDGDYKREYKRYLLFSKEETNEWKSRGERERMLRVWPLFYSRQEKDGSEYAYFPCLIPFDFRGLERSWVPLFSLYEYRRNAQGSSESKALWGIYVHRQNSLRELYEFSFLMTYYKTMDTTYFSLFKGLLEYQTGKERCALRLIYSPWPIQWDCPAEAKEAVAESGSLVINKNP